MPSFCDKSLHFVLIYNNAHIYRKCADKRDYKNAVSVGLSTMRNGLNFDLIVHEKCL